jgi:hypothetical protein
VQAQQAAYGSNLRRFHPARQRSPNNLEVPGQPTQDTQGGQGITQFERALFELNIEILCANSSQAKARVERVKRTLQDRLVKERRLAGINSIAAGNAFLPDFIRRLRTDAGVREACRTRPLLKLNQTAVHPKHNRTAVALTTM